MTHYPRRSDSADEAATSRNYWHRGRSAPDDQSISHLFWLTIFVLGCVSLLLVSWAVSTAFAKKDAEKPLLGSIILPKLNSSQGAWKIEPGQLSATPSSALDHPKERNKTELPSLPMVVEKHRETEQEPFRFPFATQEPPTMASDTLLTTIPIMDTLPLGLVESCDDPVVYLKPCTPHRGDSPMIRTWKNLALYSLLSTATVLYVPQPVVFAGGETRKEAAGDGLDKLTKSIQELTNRIKALEEKRPESVNYDIINKNIDSGFKELKKDILTDLNARLNRIDDDIRAVSKNVDMLGKDLAGLKGEQFDLQLQLNKHKSILKQLAEDIAELQRRKPVEGSPPLAVPAVDKTSLDEIRSRLSSIENSLAKMTPTEKRFSMALPNGTTTTTPTARVILKNMLTGEVAFIVNNVVYRVPGGYHKVVEVPTGSLSYEVFADPWGLLDRRATALAGGETLDLTAYKAR